MSDETYKGSSPSSILRTVAASKHAQEKLRKLTEAIEKGEPAPPPSAPPPAEPPTPDQSPTPPLP